MQLSDIDAETVQAFLNNKVADGYAYNTLKNLKWGLSSVFAAAVKYGYIKSNPVPAAELPPEDIREEAELPQASELELLIAHLPDPLNEAVWLAAVACIRPEELAFKWSDLDPVKRQLWIVRAVNWGGTAHPQVPPIEPSDSTYRIGCRAVARAEGADVRSRRRLDVSQQAQDGPHRPRTDNGPDRTTDRTQARIAAHHLENSPPLGDNADGGKQSSDQGGAATPWS